VAHVLLIAHSCSKVINKFFDKKFPKLIAKVSKGGPHGISGIDGPEATASLTSPNI